MNRLRFLTRALEHVRKQTVELPPLIIQRLLKRFKFLVGSIDFVLLTLMPHEFALNGLAGKRRETAIYRERKAMGLVLL